MAKNSTVVLAAIIVGFGLAPAASAQPLGSFRWQLQPYCNVITLAVVQQGGQYQLDGTDDQCGAAQAASVRGMAFQNLNGTIGFGLTIVTAPGGTPVHVDATISFPGSERDMAGQRGKHRQFHLRRGGAARRSTAVPSGGRCARQRHEHADRRQHHWRSASERRMGPDAPRRSVTTARLGQSGPTGRWPACRSTALVRSGETLSSLWSSRESQRFLRPAWPSRP